MPSAATSTEIRPIPSARPPTTLVRRAISELHGLGLRVMLKPHVDVQDGTWRAQIEPA